VPGCRSSRYLEVHHIVRRADGGTHEVSNLVLLCGAHHRAHHEGTLLTIGSTAATLRFTHADGRPYGSPPRPPPPPSPGSAQL
jgi:5-methylcytosine-specific restriction endonuclease McrA